jgi:outer membrane protein assembly factor BamB
MFLLACLTLPPDPPADSSTWPRFRGHNGTGIVTNMDITVKWDDRSGIVWKVPLPGFGNSSPIIWGERLYLQSATADGKERLLLCLSVKDGKILWTRSVPGNTAKTHEKNTLASSTPSTDGERVYVSIWDGKKLMLAAYDMDGNPAWTRELGPFDSQHGAGASPIVYQDKVYFLRDQDDLASMLALDAKTGRVVWEKPRQHFRACYSSPFILAKPGCPDELIVLSTMGVTSYEPHRGDVNWDWAWKFPTKPWRTTGSPIAVNDMILACSGDGGGPRHMVAIQLKGNGNGTTVRKAWENLKDFPYVPSLLSRGEHVYFVNDKGMAGCFEIRTGKRVWFERLVGATSFVSSPVMIDGKIYAPSEQGDVFVFAAEPKLRLLARNPMGEPIRASPAVADNRLYIRTESYLYCIGKTPKR